MHLRLALHTLGLFAFLPKRACAFDALVKGAAHVRPQGFQLGRRAPSQKVSGAAWALGPPERCAAGEVWIGGVIRCIEPVPGSLDIR